MANVRVYDFDANITTGTQPNAGTPSAANDLVTKSYVDGLVGTRKQEALSGTVNGVNVTFTVSQTPINDDSFLLFVNGVLQKRVTHYTRAGSTITMVAAPVVGQDLDAFYFY